MNRSRWFVLILAVSLVSCNLTLSLAQEKPAATAAPLNMNETDVQWLWGEVVSADLQKGELSVKYLDYEADIEKEIVMGTDDKTTYENIKSISEIKPQDTVSIDYIVTPEGRNLAKNISVEKPEAMPPVKEEGAMAPQANATEVPAAPSATESGNY